MDPGNTGDDLVGRVTDDRVELHAVYVGGAVLQLAKAVPSGPARRHRGRPRISDVYGDQLPYAAAHMTGHDPRPDRRNRRNPDRRHRPGVRTAA
ncbi:hypothetical protein GCM10009810_12070 [Nostocoides vanveenii]|uniref:Uncharacterized protein n=1 Tax=Nostocoides vanveenii TaxID=330835 RepID=A0ABN2KDT9_9MICO